MRLCIATPRLRGNDGEGRVNLEIAREALRRGHSLRCVSCEIDSRLARDLDVIWHRIPLGPIPTQLLRSLAFIAAASIILALRSRKDEIRLSNGFSFMQRPDVAAVHFLYGSWLECRHHASRQYRDLRGLYHWVHDCLHASLERLAIKRASHVVAVSDRVREDLVRLGYAMRQTTVIPNGVDFVEFAGSEAQRERFGLPRDRVIAVFAGDLRSPRKNLDTVLEAMMRLEDIELAVAGFTSRSRYPRMAAELGLSDRVHFLGCQKDMPAVLRSVDFLVFPSRYDPFGLVVLEACAAGLPVIVSRAAGASSIVGPDCAILLEDTEDAEALAREMQRLAASPELRRRMGAAGQRLASSFDWPVAAQRYLDIIETTRAPAPVGSKAKSHGQVIA